MNDSAQVPEEKHNQQLQREQLFFPGKLVREGVCNPSNFISTCSARDLITIVSLSSLYRNFGAKGAKIQQVLEQTPGRRKKRAKREEKSARNPQQKRALGRAENPIHSKPV